MMVARHEMPGKQAETIRPVGNGVIRSAWPYPSSETLRRPFPPDHTVPYGTVHLHPYREAIVRLRPGSTPLLQRSITPVLHYSTRSSSTTSTTTKRVGRICYTP
jgi:hypothetical protein